MVGRFADVGLTREAVERPFEFGRTLGLRLDRAGLQKEILGTLQSPFGVQDLRVRGGKVAEIAVHGESFSQAHMRKLLAGFIAGFEEAGKTNPAKLREGQMIIFEALHDAFQQRSGELNREISRARGFEDTVRATERRRCRITPEIIGRVATGEATPAERAMFDNYERAVKRALDQRAELIKFAAPGYADHSTAIKELEKMAEKLGKAVDDLGTVREDLRKVVVKQTDDFSRFLLRKFKGKGTVGTIAAGAAAGAVIAGIAAYYLKEIFEEEKVPKKVEPKLDF